MHTTNDDQPAPARSAAVVWWRGRRAWLALAIVGAVAAAVVAAIALSGDDSDPSEGERADLARDDTRSPQALVDDAATTMGAVTSLEFSLTVTGTPVFIDEFDTIAMKSMIGEFTVPRRAAAKLDVEIGGSLDTQIGAVAIDDRFWVSDPITGRFSTLPEGFEIDPSKFFDPALGWQPLLESLDGVEEVADDGGRDGTHLRGTAPADQVSDITVGLVDDQSLLIDLWVDLDTSLVSALEFTTVLTDGDAEWTVEFDRFGEPVTIDLPEGVS